MKPVCEFTFLFSSFQICIINKQCVHRLHPKLLKKKKTDFFEGESRLSSNERADCTVAALGEELAEVG